MLILEILYIRYQILEMIPGLLKRYYISDLGSVEAVIDARYFECKVCEFCIGSIYRHLEVSVLTFQLFFTLGRVDMQVIGEILNRKNTFQHDFLLSSRVTD